MGTAREQLASRLKEARLAAGYDSHNKLAKAILLSRPVIARAESPTQPVPSDAVLAAWSKTTGADRGELTKLAQRAKSGTPEWFMPYRAAEQEAEHLRLWAPLVVPGLLQTANYARSLLSAKPRPAEQLQALVDQRLERQQIIGRAYVVAVLDSGVLKRLMGSPAIMSEQCGYLGQLVEDQSISLHVVPEGTNIGVGGAFDIATRSGASTVCLTTSSRDITSIAPDVVDENVRLFDALLGAALPVVQSLEYVRTQEEIWKEKA